MNAKFFTVLDGLWPSSKGTIAFEKLDNGKFIATVLIRSKKEGKDQRLRPTINFEATAEELDEQFFAALMEPLQKTREVLTNREEYEQQLQQERNRPQGGKASSGNSEAQKRAARKERFTALMDKVKKLETDGKCREAVAALPKEEEYIEFAEDIKKKSAELWSKINTPTLF